MMRRPTDEEVTERADALYLQWHAPWSLPHVPDTYEAALAVARRQLRAEFAEQASDSGTEEVQLPEVSPANVRAERDRRIAAGEPHGYKALATHFMTSIGTIRRRLGKL
jgi:hypothetical protein